MKYWEGIRYLLWTDIRNARWKNLIFLVLVVYISIFTQEGLADIISSSVSDIGDNRFLMDYLIIAIFSVMGLVTTHIYGYGWKKDLLAERLAYWRSLPIKIDQIVWSRLIGVTTFSFLSIAGYYSLTAWIVSSRGTSIEIISYVLHGLTVFAIIYFFNVACLFVEMSFSYKTYMIYCWIFPFTLLAIIISYSFMFDFYLLQGIYEAVQKAPAIMAGASIILVIAAYFLAFRLINERVRTKNIL